MSFGWLIRVLPAVLACGFAWAQTQDAVRSGLRYSYTAQRGLWPANAANSAAYPAERYPSDTRFVTADLKRTDLVPLSSLLGQKNGETSKHIAVLFMGSDWCEAGNLLLRTWRLDNWSDGFGKTVYDLPERDFILKEEDSSTNLSALSRGNAYAGRLYTLGNGSARTYSWPAIGLYDGDGKGYALFSAADAMDAGELTALVTQARERYDAYLKLRDAAEAVTQASLETDAAAGTNGLHVTDAGTVTDAGGREITPDIYRASLLAKALVCLEPNVRRLADLNTANQRKDDFDRIRAWDPQDVSGAWRRLTADDLYYLSGKFRNTDPSLKAELQTWLENTRLVPLSDNMLQQRYLLGNNYWRACGRPEIAEAYAREAIRLNPASFWGEGAAGHLLMNGKTGPVTIGFGWAKRHFVPAEGIPSREDAPAVSAETVRAQDGVVIDGNTFRWVLRRGNDMYINYPGWYTLTMKPQTEGMTVTAVRIYRDAAQTETERLQELTAMFDSGRDPAQNVQPADGDAMGAYAALNLPKALGPDAPLTFDFYLPERIRRTVPRKEKDNGDVPPFNDIALIVEGTFTAPTDGSLTVQPAHRRKAATPPMASELWVDGRTLSLKDALKTFDSELADAEPAKDARGRAVADTVQTLVSDRTSPAALAYQTALTRAALFYEHESDRGFSGKITEVMQEDRGGAAMMNALLGDIRWMSDLLMSGPAPDAGCRGGGSRSAPEDVLHRLALLWETDRLYVTRHPETRRGELAAAPGTGAYDPVLRRMAAAGALNAGPTDNGNVANTHTLYRRLADKGQLHGDFYTQSAAQMRTSLNPMAYHIFDIEYAVKSGNTRIDNIDATAWQSSYLDRNFFGDSVFGSDYFLPWDRTMLPGTAMGREIGAVCGGISYYGALCAVASGRRSVPGGQPGHCAAMHRSFDGSFWEIDSNFGKPTGNHFALWGNYLYQAQEFYDDMWDDPKTVIGYRLYWAARQRALRYGEKEAGTEALLKRAVQAAPLCYPAILGWRDWLKAEYPDDADRWLEWAEAVTYGLWRYPSLGWNLLNAEIPGPVRKAYGEEGLLAAMKQLHVRMHDADRKTREGYFYNTYTLEKQVGQFRSPANFVSLLATILDVRYGTPRFTDAMNWGNGRYKTGTEGSTDFMTMLNLVYENHGDSLGMRGTCLTELMTASQSDNLSVFRDMSALYVSLYPDDPAVPADEVPPYPERMLSADGLLMLSSYPEPNLKGTPEDLRVSAKDIVHMSRVIDGSVCEDGAATQPQYEAPWMIVRLPGDAEIRGVFIRNGREAVRLSVEISPNMNQWTPLVLERPVAAGGELKLDFDGSEVSKYVRVTRTDPADGQKIRLHLKKFQVFANPRY